MIPSEVESFCLQESTSYKPTLRGIVLEKTDPGGLLGEPFGNFGSPALLGASKTAFRLSKSFKQTSTLL